MLNFLSQKIKKLFCKLRGHSLLHMVREGHYDYYFCERCGWVDNILELIKHRMYKAEQQMLTEMDMYLLKDFGLTKK